jgi:hypothetical protein
MGSTDTKYRQKAKRRNWLIWREREREERERERSREEAER